MKKFIIIFLGALILALASCSGAAVNEEASGQNKDDYFEVKIFPGKASYSPNEPIVCYATVEYIGEEDAVTVYNYDPLIWFSIEGEGFYGRSEFRAYLTMNEFKKGVPQKYEFEKTGKWDNKSGGDKIYYDGDEIFLFGGKFKFSANMLYFWDKYNRPGLGHIITASVAVNVQDLPTESYIAIIIIAIIFVCFPGFFRLSFKLKQMKSMRTLSDYEPTVYREPTFEEKLKKAKLKPQKIITFGTNRFAADSTKKKLFVRSSKAIDGVLLDYEDIVSYELIKDGKVIGRPVGGLIDSTAAAGEDGIICSDLRLVIKTKKTSDPEVVLPFIAFSIDSEFAYKEALGAAKEAAQALDGVMG